MFQFIFATQKKISIYNISLVFIGLIINLLNFFLFHTITIDEFFINLFLLLTFLPIMFYTYFSKSMIARVIQILCFLLLGIIMILFNSLIDSTGAVFIALSFIASYEYGFIKNIYKYLLPILIVFIFSFKLISFMLKIYLIIPELSSSPFTSILSSVFIITYMLLVLFSFKNPFSQRITLDVFGLLHSLKLDISKVMIESIFKYVKTKYPDDIFLNSSVDSIRLAFKSQNIIRNNLLYIGKQLQSNLFKIQTIDINDTLKGLVAIYNSSKEVLSVCHIKMQLSKEPLYLSCYPIEFHLIIDNVIRNSLDSVSMTDKNRIVKIKSFKKDRFTVIEIFNNGPPIKSYSSKVNINVNDLISSKKDGGFGLKYINRTIIENNGFLTLRNVDDGVIYTLSFKGTKNG